MVFALAGDSTITSLPVRLTAGLDLLRRGFRSTGGGVRPSCAGVRPIRTMRVPHTPHCPEVEGDPARVKVGSAARISRFCLHFTQYASNRLSYLRY